MIISQLSISPIGEDISLGKYVKIAIESIKNDSLNFKTNAMSTVIETEDLDTLLRVVQKAHNSVLASGVDRVITELKIDDRKDKNATMETKLKSIK